MFALLHLCLLLVTSFASETFAQTDTANPEGKALYITSPTCGFYRCFAQWPVGSQQLIQWLNPPTGDVSIQLNPLNISDGLPTIFVTNSTSASGGDCNNSQYSCGQFEYQIPEDVPQGNYSVQVTSLSTGASGYSDRLTILPPALLPAYATSGIPSIFAVPSIPGGQPSASQSLSEVGSAAPSAEATVQDVIVQNISSASVTTATTYTATIVAGPTQYIYSAPEQYVSCAISGSDAQCIQTAADVASSAFSVVF